MTAPSPAADAAPHADQPDLWVIGAGGHAKVVIETARAAGYSVAGVLDDDPARLGQDVRGVPVLGAGTADDARRLGVEAAVTGVGGNAARATIAARLDGLVRWKTIVHPTAVLGEGVQIGAGSVVFAGVV